MSRKFIFDNKEISIPGAYNRITSGINNPGIALAFGNTLIIDNGLGAGHGGKAGISGTLEKRKDALYTFDNVRDFQNFINGGPLHILAKALFNPSPNGSGVTSLTYARAASTTPSEIAYSFTGGGANGGTIAIQSKDEGRGANGVSGDEIRAKGTLTVTVAGSAGEEITVSVDGASIGAYIVGTTPSVGSIAAGIADAINKKSAQTGFDASASAGAVTINFAPGAGESATAKTISLSGNITTTITAVNFSGGVDGTILTQGIAAKIKAGEVDSAKFILEFYRGTYKGHDGAISPTSDHINGKSPLDTLPALMAKSIEFSSIAELVSWMNGNSQFGKNFKLKTSTVNGDGSITSADLISNAGYKLATGGTEVYNSDEIDNVLNEILTQKFDFILACDHEGNVKSNDNTKLLAYITQEATVKPTMYIGGAYNDGDFSENSLAAARFFNSEHTSIVHSGVKLPSFDGSSEKIYKSIYHAAVVLGREAGLQPQVPTSFKDINILGLVHEPNQKEIKQALEAGVIVVSSDEGNYEIVRGINTLQNNDNLINQDGSSFSNAIVRIKRQIGKELTTSIKNEFLKNPNGSNRFTTSPEAVETFVNGFLKLRSATKTEDNLLLKGGRASARIEQDTIYVTYEMTVNGPVEFIFSTGIIVS